LLGSCYSKNPLAGELPREREKRRGRDRERTLLFRGELCDIPRLLITEQAAH